MPETSNTGKLKSISKELDQLIDDGKFDALELLQQFKEDLEPTGITEGMF